MYARGVSDVGLPLMAKSILDLVPESKLSSNCPIPSSTVCGRPHRALDRRVR